MGRDLMEQSLRVQEVLFESSTRPHIMAIHLEFRTNGAQIAALESWRKTCGTELSARKSV